MTILVNEMPQFYAQINSKQLHVNRPVDPMSVTTKSQQQYVQFNKLLLRDEFETLILFFLSLVKSCSATNSEANEVGTIDSLRYN